MLHKDIHRYCLLLVLSIVFFGCAGFKDVSYFKPLPQGGIRVASGMRGLPEIVKVQLSETVELSLIVFDQAQHSLLRMIFHLPAGEMAKFESSNIIATPFGDARVMIGTIETIRAIYVIDGRGSFRYLAARDNLDGATYEYNKAFGGKASVPRQFEINVAFPTQLPDHFSLRMPALKLSGKVTLMPEVEFQRQTGSAYQGSAP